jgi:short chain dehydrogenase
LLASLGRVYGPVPLDVTNETQAKYAVDAAIQAFGGLDILVNNAGYENVSSGEDTAVVDFRAQIETNLFRVIIMTKTVLLYFRERRAAHFIQISSIGGRVGPAGCAAYAAAKVGAEGFQSRFQRGPIAWHKGDNRRTDFAGSSTELHAKAGGVCRDRRHYSPFSARLQRQATAAQSCMLEATRPL